MYNLSELPLETQFTLNVIMNNIDQGNIDEVKQLAKDLLVQYTYMREGMKEMMKEKIMQDMQNNASFIIL